MPRPLFSEPMPALSDVPSAVLLTMKKSPAWRESMLGQADGPLVVLLSVASLAEESWIWQPPSDHHEK
jgi:hypothetical protein